MDNLDISEQLNEIFKPNTIKNMTLMQGGLSREIYKLNISNDEAYLLRLLSENKYSNYEQEKFYFKLLSDHGIGPKLIYSGKGFRIEQFFDSTLIKASQLVNYHRQLAYCLGSIHNIQHNTNDEDFLGKLFNNEHIMNTYARKCKELAENEKEFLQILNDTDFINEKEFILSITKDEEKVLSHNDIWVNNILITNEDKIKIIDYELMGTNFRAYDLGKLILESIFERHTTGVMYKLELCNFPSEREIVDFIYDYLCTTEMRLNPLDYPLAEVKKMLLTRDGAENRVNEIYRGIFKGILVACFYLTILGVVLGKEFREEMDFFQFGVDHYYLYRKYKEIYFSLKTVNFQD
jgi:thiamine kinase-like enzyme